MANPEEASVLQGMHGREHTKDGQGRLREEDYYVNLACSKVSAEARVSHSQWETRG